jgi:hypothetical protein
MNCTVYQRNTKGKNAPRRGFDNIIPVSKVGSNTAKNIQLLCKNCNRSKAPILADKDCSNIMARCYLGIPWVCLCGAGDRGQWVGMVRSRIYG